MNKMKVMTIVGTRPELIKLSRVIAELDEHTNHVLVHTGQNYDDELNKIFFDELEIKQPNYFLNAAGKNSLQTISEIISKVDPVIAEEKPDAVLIYGDTNSCLSAIAAKRHKIPLFHMEAGNRSFDERVPEEINRRIVDHISDINMPLTEHARNYLIKEGINPETIIKTGSCMQEVLDFYSNKIEKSKICETLEVNSDNFFLISSHREENVDSPDRLESLLSSLDALIEEFDKEIIFSVHPRTQARLDNLASKSINKKINFMKAIGFIDYIKLQKEAFCVISDSGTISEESSILNFPAITIRQAHERPEGMDEGLLIMSDLIPDKVINAVKIV
ncbi:UDP-N-acetylglucosamine 2-epimerase (non-hydrolyzing), partial [Gammaproteobacteria bacterium]|nr:UDP-N-acetylglucosamine 2-epimerase (non-hydrolyzing) [Gammaproteobacteria bacterium]